MELTKKNILNISEGIHNQNIVQGLTHCFYRYPARFSPSFANSMIVNFSKPGDVVLDPFLGGGTSLIEAFVLGRKGIGTDISSLATFISKVKTTPLETSEIEKLTKWIKQLKNHLNIRNKISRPNNWIERGYQRNINTRETWRIRKYIEIALEKSNELSTTNQQDFIRCLILRTGQWALDYRRSIPSVKEFRLMLMKFFDEMITQILDFSERVKLYENPTILTRSAIGLESDQKIASFIPPRLILTSPPYPGVHVLYHRWQVRGRKETPAPFWIADSLDGNGESYYLLGNRHQEDLKDYYDNLFSVFSSLSKISDQKTLVAQLISFSSPDWQLEKYLQVMENAGFREIKMKQLSNSDDGRIWRIVPNRKWYALHERSKSTSSEVVLFHALK